MPFSDQFTVQKPYPWGLHIPGAGETPKLKKVGGTLINPLTAEFSPPKCRF